MNNKRKISVISLALAAVLLAVGLLSSLLTGCSGAPKTTESQSIPAFSLTIEGVEGTTAFTHADAKKLPYTELETSVTNKNGETTTALYGGVLLKDLLESIGVKELGTLTIEAADGYASEYDSALAFAEDVIVGWQKDGKPLENGEIVIMPAKASGKTTVKQAVKLIVTK